MGNSAVVAASAGNHAQGVALAARLLGVEATVYMPEGAALPKVAATQEYGATVVLGGGSVDEALHAARAHADRTGAVLIHPFDQRDVVAGQGTIALEILEQVPDVRTILVPVGGGGLAAGIVAALGDEHPDVTVIGAEPNGLNINDGYGSTHPEELCNAVVANGADVGISLDGDGDRCIMVDHEGMLVDGDQLLYAIALDRHRHGLFERDDENAVERVGHGLQTFPPGCRAAARPPLAGFSGCSEEPSSAVTASR